MTKQSQRTIHIRRYDVFTRKSLDKSIDFEFFIYNRHFLPYGRADLTVSALLQVIRGEIPQLHNLRLASAAISTRE